MAANPPPRPDPAPTTRGRDERPFPILSGQGSIPWGFIAAHEARAYKNHGQTLARLAERGGLSFDEALAIVEDRPFALLGPGESKAALATLIETWRAAKPAPPAPYDSSRGEGVEALARVILANCGAEWARGNIAEWDKQPHRVQVEALRCARAVLAHLTSTRESPVAWAWAITNPRMSGRVLKDTEAEAREIATMDGDRVVPLYPDASPRHEAGTKEREAFYEAARRFGVVLGSDFMETFRALLASESASTGGEAR